MDYKKLLRDTPITLMSNDLRDEYIIHQLDDYRNKLHCGDDELVKLANAMREAVLWANAHDEERHRMLQEQKAKEECERRLAEREAARKKNLADYKNLTDALINEVGDIL